MNFFGGACKDVENWAWVQRHHTQHDQHRTLYRGLWFDTDDAMHNTIAQIGSCMHQTTCSHWTESVDVARDFATTSKYGLIYKSFFSDATVVFDYTDFAYAWSFGLAEQARKQREVVIMPGDFDVVLVWFIIGEAAC